jgi:hypothetical protein
MTTSITRTPALALALASCLAMSLAACGCKSSGQGNSGTKSGGGTQQDLAALQGRWDQLPDEPGGSGSPRQLVIKEVSGNTETVTTYGPDGRVLQAQTAQFRLSRSGPVRVYSVQDPKVTQGPSEGNSQASPRRLAYVYRVHGHEFDEVWGLLPGQEEREVVVKRWRRAGAGR